MSTIELPTMNICLNYSLHRCEMGRRRPLLGGFSNILLAVSLFKLTERGSGCEDSPADIVRVWDRATVRSGASWFCRIDQSSKLHCR